MCLVCTPLQTKGSAGPDVHQHIADGKDLTPQRHVCLLLEMLEVYTGPDRRGGKRPTVQRALTGPQQQSTCNSWTAMPRDKVDSRGCSSAKQGTKTDKTHRQWRGVHDGPSVLYPVFRSRRTQDHVLPRKHVQPASTSTFQSTTASHTSD